MFRVLRAKSARRAHPLRGAVFESWVAAEVFKARVHRGLPPALAFYRDSKGAEVDLVVELANEWLAIETKSGQTLAGDLFAGLEALAQAAAASRPPRPVKKFLVYGGNQTQQRSGATAIGWRDLAQHTWTD